MICPDCQKKFGTPSALHNHIRIHTKKKPFPSLKRVTSRHMLKLSITRRNKAEIKKIRGDSAKLKKNKCKFSLRLASELYAIWVKN